MFTDVFILKKYLPPDDESFISQYNEFNIEDYESSNWN